MVKCKTCGQEVLDRHLDVQDWVIASKKFVYEVNVIVDINDVVVGRLVDRIAYYDNGEEVVLQHVKTPWSVEVDVFSKDDEMYLDSVLTTDSGEERLQFTLGLKGRRKRMVETSARDYSELKILTENYTIDKMYTDM